MGTWEQFVKEDKGDPNVEAIIMLKNVEMMWDAVTVAVSTEWHAETVKKVQGKAEMNKVYQKLAFEVDQREEGSTALRVDELILFLAYVINALIKSNTKRRKLK